MDSAIEDSAEQESQSLVDGGAILIGKAVENVQGVHEKAICLSLVQAFDGLDDVTW